MVRVELLVYDLSRGLALSMSEAILGQRIDGIWHTGVVVYNKEYYYGGGIQVSPLGSFSSSNGMPVTKTIYIGETNKTINEIELFLQSIRSKFNALTYDLINNNCNHFSNELTSFLCNQSIPNEIVNLPNIIFNTPKGALLRPMIENIQRSIYQNNNSTLDPFNSNTSSTNNGFENQLSNNIHNSLLHSKTIQKIELEENQLISNDSTSISILINKIIKTLDSNINNSQINQLNHILKEIELKSFRFTVNDYQLLYDLLVNNATIQMSCLFVLRLMVLHLPAESIDISNVVKGILELLEHKKLTTIPSITMGLCFLSNLLSNNGFKYIINESVDLSNQLLDITSNYLHHERNEVKQISSVIIYNYILLHTKAYELSDYWKNTSDEINPQVIQILISILDNLSNENDIITRKRRLSIVSRLIRSFGTELGKLARELGFIDIIKELQEKLNTTINNKDKDYEESLLVELAIAFT